jgi:hypothetical protein
MAKNQDRIRPLQRAPVDLENAPISMWNVGTLIFGALGMVMRIKLAAWAACFCCLGLCANLKPAESDWKQVLSSVLLSFASVVLVYVQPQSNGFFT